MTKKTLSFAEVRPDLLERWDWGGNAALDPMILSPYSRQVAWWTCPVDDRHRWKAQIQVLTGGAKCAVCHGAQVQAGVNDLASNFPNLATEWHSSKNEPLRPNDVTASSHKKVWWNCPLDSRHEYEATIANRSGRNSGCPVCAGKKVLVGVNDVQTTNPELLLQWDFELNLDCSPSQFTAGSHRSVIWKCANSHVWKAAIKDRVRGRDCPFCVNKFIAEGENDLATSNPELVSEWDQAANLPLTPQSIGAGSNRKVFWVCANDTDHRWRATPSSRTSSRATGCPACAKYGFSPSDPGILYFIEHKELRARKIGITNLNAKTDRLGAFVGNGWKILYSVSNNEGQKIADAESFLFRWLRRELKLPVYLGKVDMANMAGNTETFASDEGPSSEEIIQRIRKILESDAP